MTEVKFELFAKKKDDPSEPKPLRIHKGELYHKPNEFGIDVETCNQDVSIELVITPKDYKEARAIGLGCTRIKPIKRTRKRQIAKAKHVMACHDQRVTRGHSGGTAKLEIQGGTSMKEYKCDFCYESHELVDHSSPLTELITGPWEEAFAHLKASDEIDAPEDLIHGLPFRYSMMIWRKGYQAESAIIYNLESSEEAGMMILSPGFLGPLCCPVCGRPLNEEEE